MLVSQLKLALFLSILFCLFAKGTESSKDTNAVSKAMARKCTGGSDSTVGCRGKTVLSRCTEESNPGVCTPHVWHENNEAECACVKFPAKQIDDFLNGALNNEKGK